MSRALIGPAVLGLVIALGGTTAAAQTIVTRGSGFTAPGSVVVDATGDVFVTDNSAVKEIAAGGNAVTTLIAGAPPPEGIAIDGNGNLFFFDHVGRLYETTAAGGYPAARQIAAGFAAPVGLAVDASGDVFVADAGSQVGEGTIRELTAASGFATAIRIGGTFQTLGAIVLDGAGNLYALEPDDGLPNAGSLVEVVAAGGYVTVRTLATGLDQPAGLAIDGAANLFITESDQPWVKEVTAASGYVTIATLGSGLKTPAGLIVDADENIFVADFNAGAIVELPAANGYSTTIDFGLGLHRPVDVALDGNGNLFIADDERGGIAELTAASSYGTLQIVADSTVSGPNGVAMDSYGNLFVADGFDNAVKEIPAAGGYASIQEIACCLPGPAAIALDGSDNIFVSFGGGIEEIFAAQGYTTAALVGAGFGGGAEIALDGSGNLYIADTGGNAIRKAAPAGGYGTVTTLYSAPSLHPGGITVDSAGDVFFTEQADSSIVELQPADGYATPTPIGSGYDMPRGLAVDSSGNLYVADQGNNVVKEVLAAPSPIQASILPGARLVQLGTTATVFATMINSGSTALSGCGVALPDPAPDGLTLTYQTTNPTTNALTGSPDTPVTLAGGNGMQSFVLAFQGTSTFSVLNLAPVFACSNAEPAALLPFVDTLDLGMLTTPTPDIIAVAATPSGGGIFDVPVGRIAAFAIATTNLGAGGPLYVQASTTTTLPITYAAVCQTDPVTAQCMAAPTAMPQVTFTEGGQSTFSVFIGAGAAIPFAPGTSRVVVEFFDAAHIHGLTSVAVETAAP